MSFKVQVDDNFHYQDESERYTLGVYKEYWVALQKCREIVDEFLAENYQEGMSPDELYESYTSFGEDPFIMPTPYTQNRFSAWNYAKIKARAICGEKVDSSEYILDKHPSEWAPKSLLPNSLHGPESVEEGHVGAGDTDGMKDDSDDSKAKTPRVGSGTCPFCGDGNSYAGYDDTWWCDICHRSYPTQAFKCHHPDCWEHVFLDDYCELHKQPKVKK